MNQIICQVLYIKYVMQSSYRSMLLRCRGVESFALGHTVGSPVEPGLEPTLVWL